MKLENAISFSLEMKKKVTLKVEEIEFSIFGNKAEFIVFSIENMEDLYFFKNKSEWPLSEFIYDWLYSRFRPEIEKFIYENEIRVCEGFSAKEARGDFFDMGIFLNMEPSAIEIRRLASHKDNFFIPSQIIEIECDLEKEYEDFVEKKNEEKIPDEELIRLYYEDLKKEYGEIDKELAENFLPGTLVIPKGCTDYKRIKLVAYWGDETSQGIDFGTPTSSWYSFKDYRPIGRIF